jgi:hypothetical protein
MIKVSEKAWQEGLNDGLARGENSRAYFVGLQEGHRQRKMEDQDKEGLWESFKDSVRKGFKKADLAELGFFMLMGVLIPCAIILGTVLIIVSVV